MQECDQRQIEEGCERYGTRKEEDLCGEGCRDKNQNPEGRRAREGKTEREGQREEVVRKGDSSLFGTRLIRKRESRCLLLCWWMASSTHGRSVDD
jgi:hypothetical protein